MKLREVGENYDRAAKHYDRLTDIVFGTLLRAERSRTEAVESLGDIDGARVLDIGCGTGRNLPLLMPRVGERGQVVALDYSEGMLERARVRVVRADWNNVELVRGDAAELAGVDGPFDAVISVWCMGIVHDLPAALNRAIDVIRPGGHLVVMDFDRARPDHGPLRWLYPIYSTFLRRAGIDSAEDLDDSLLRAKWAEGHAIIDQRLHEVHERRHLWGAGFLKWGERPAQA